MSLMRDDGGRVMRIAVSAVVFLIALLVGAKTQWVAVSDAAATAAEDRIFAAAVLGETSPDASSAELVDAAVVRGDIGPEYGLVYGVYLACAKDLLPAEYRGAELASPEPQILSEADVVWADLSPEVRHELRAVFTRLVDAEHGGPCRDHIRRLADRQEVWWTEALREDQPAPGATVLTANRP